MPQLSDGFSDYQHFSMGGWVTIAFNTIAGFGDDFPFGIGDDRRHRHFTFGHRVTGKNEGGCHVLIGKTMVCHIATIAYFDGFRYISKI